MRFTISGQRAAGLGDDVAMTAVVREYRRHHPDEVIRMDISPRQRAIFEGNPYVPGGTHDNKQVFLFNPMGHENQGNLVQSFARQVGLPVIDPTPEVFLSEDEMRDVVKLLDAEMRPDTIGGKRLVAVDAWATWPSRRWPSHRFFELVRLLNERGFTTVELGSPVPSEDGATYQPSLPTHIKLYGKTTIRQAAAVLRASSLFIGNDSGLMHLAAAVGTPQVVPFSVKKWFSRSYWNTVPVIPLMPCLPMCKIACAAQDGHCLRTVTPAMMMEAVEVAMRRFS